MELQQGLWSTAFVMENRDPHRRAFLFLIRVIKDEIWPRCRHRSIPPTCGKAESFKRQAAMSTWLLRKGSGRIGRLQPKSLKPEGRTKVSSQSTAGALGPSCALSAQAPKF